MRALTMLVFASLFVVGCGVEGPPGPQGLPGAPGVALRDSYYCETEAYLTSTNYFPLVYQRHRFGDGTIITQCYVVGTAFTSSSTEVYNYGQHGADVGRCVVGADVDTATGGRWDFSFSLPGTTATAIYVDPLSNHRNKEFSFDCQRFPQTDP